MDETRTSVNDLAKACARSADAAEWEEFVRRSTPLASLVALRVCRMWVADPSPATVDDIVQEVFLKLFSRLAQYRPRDAIPFEHWVSRLAVRTCLDSLRAERRRPELRWSDLGDEGVAWLQYVLLAKDAPPDASPAAAREVVENLLRQLPPKDRLVISLLDLEQRSVKEVSVITGWSATLVKVRAFRARRRLRKIAAELESEVRDA